MITPREMLRDYMTVLNILMQNSAITFEQIMEKEPNGEAPQPKDEGTVEQGEKKRFSASDIEF